MPRYSKKIWKVTLKRAELVQHVRAGVQNMDRIISTLLLFAKSSKPSRQQCDINLLLSQLLDGLDDVKVPENIKVVRDFDKEEMMANGDRELLRQVFPNLIRNAIQAMPDGGELRIQTRKALIPTWPKMIETWEPVNSSPLR